ncbi:MAG: chemotaxis response regulator protein-glutamate methylesterase, partial [Selenomonadaceae bacterium]
MINILIADDSAFMRKVLSDLFTRQSDFNVVGVAINGKDAIDKVLKHKPDLLTMDINMPIMDGLLALKVIMEECPLPVIMFSSLTKEGADATVMALGLGAVDFISKTNGAISRIDTIEEEILEKCRAAAKVNLNMGIESKNRMLLKKREVSAVERENTEKIVRPYPVDNPGTMIKPMMQIQKKMAATVPAAPAAVFFERGADKLVAIGTSTGGPRALQNVITKLPKNMPCGVVIVQHMPPGFTKSLAERLDTISQIAVKEAENQEIIEAGHVYIAPGNYHMVVQKKGMSKIILLNQDPPLASHRPAVDVLFDSVAPFGKEVVSVILTGMGADGSQGMKKIKAAGGYIIAEDESTAVVYGMPKAVVDLGIADKVLPLQHVAEA